MRIVNIHEAKTHFSKLVDAVVHGSEILIAMAGKPVAKLVPISKNQNVVWAYLKERSRYLKIFMSLYPKILLLHLKGNHENFTRYAHFFWWIKNDRRLSKIAQSKISVADEVYVSSASIWELAIKIKLKKLHADIAKLEEAIPASDFLELPISARHAAAVMNLPDIHRDPFDRILIAQAICKPSHIYYS